MQHSEIHSHVYGEKARALKAGTDFALDEYEDLSSFGVGGYDEIAHMARIHPKYAREITHGFGMDAIQQPVTTMSNAVPLQFLQNWMPGHVAIATAVRQIDLLTGIMTIGSWEDEQIIIRTMEMTGTTTPYSDTSNTPLTTWNPNYVQRTVVRFEAGMMVGRLEEARTARIQENSAALKRDGATLNLAIQRNVIGFYGYNSGHNNTYGMLNDPNLLSYNNAYTDPVTSSTLWSDKTFQGIIQDIRLAVAGLALQSQGLINDKTPMTLVLPTNIVPYLNVTTDYGISVKTWLKDAYGNMRIESCPQFEQANGSANVFYLYADSVEDGLSTDDNRTWLQVVPAKFQVVGVQQMTKGYKEDYTMATAGVVCKRPYAVYRVTGI
jgi:hypothetical protein